VDNSWGEQSGGVDNPGGGQSLWENRGVDNQEVEKTTMNPKKDGIFHMHQCEKMSFLHIFASMRKENVYM